jgi:hypothetical protein
LSVEDETFENSISIFPNPTKHQLTITAIQGVFIEKYDIIDASGKQIRNSQTKNSNRVDIDITDFNLGVFGRDEDRGHVHGAPDTRLAVGRGAASAVRAWARARNRLRAVGRPTRPR